MVEHEDSDTVRIRISRKIYDKVVGWSKKYHWPAPDLLEDIIVKADELDLANPKVLFESETQVPTKAEREESELKRQGEKWKAVDIPLCDQLDHFMTKNKPGFYCTGGPAYGRPKMERLAGDLDEAQRICAIHLRTMAADRARKKLNAEVKLERDEGKLRERMIKKIIKKDKASRKKYPMFYPNSLNEKDLSGLSMSRLSRRLDLMA